MQSERKTELPTNKIKYVATCFVSVALLATATPSSADAWKSKYKCNQVFRAFGSAINAYDKHLMKYAAFAKGSGFSLTGMKGCGWANGKKTQAEADRIAMKMCREDAKDPDKCHIALRYKD